MVKDSEQDIADRLHSAALHLLRRARTVDVGMDLDGPRASALSVLVFAGPVPLTRLAAIEQVSPPAITKTVTALEKAGLATRTRWEVDRRVVHVAATDAGKALLHAGRAARVRVVADLIADLPAADLDILSRAADLIEAAIRNREPITST
jgi:DNA-binding MarR family transcriptional regulator